MALRLLRSLFRWCSQCLFNRPTCLYSSVQRLVVDSNFGSPVLQTKSFTPKRNHSSVGAIEYLFFWCSPSAIFRRISFRSIDSVNAVRRRRLWSHIGVEFLERFPLLAYCDSASAVGWKVFGVRIVASSLNFFPCSVFQAIAKSVTGIAACSAAISAVPNQIGPINRLFFAALASTKPVRPAAAVWYFVHDTPFAKLLANQVFKAWVPSIRICVRHESTSITGLFRTASQLQLIGCSYFSTSVTGELSHAS